MSRLTTGAAALIVCLLPVAGCDHSAPPVPRETATLGSLPQLTDAQAAGLVSMPWRTTSSAPAGTQVVVSVPGAQCYQVVGAQAREATAAVTVAVWGRRTACTGVPANVMAVVQLPRPLGGRSLAHAPVTTASVASSR